MSRRTLARNVQRAEAHPLGDSSVEYPEWYLVHWHFIPGGYLTRFSSGVYEQLIRRLYSAGQESRINEKIARLVFKQFPDGRLLELGCGPGRMLEALDEAGPAAEIIGIDLSPFLLERAAKRNEMALAPTRVVHGNVEALPFGDGFFDAAIATHLFGHLPKEVVERAMAEAYRVVRPGGRVYLYEHRWHKILPGPWRRLGVTQVGRSFGRIIVLERSRVLERPR